MSVEATGLAPACFLLSSEPGTTATWRHSVYILSDDPLSLLFCHLPQTFPLEACLIQASEGASLSSQN